MSDLKLLRPPYSLSVSMKTPSHSGLLASPKGAALVSIPRQTTESQTGVGYDKTRAVKTMDNRKAACGCQTPRLMPALDRKKEDNIVWVWNCVQCGLNKNSDCPRD